MIRLAVLLDSGEARLSEADRALLVSDLRARGVEAQVRIAEPSRSAGGVVGEIAVRLLEAVESHALDALAGALAGAFAARLRRPATDRRTVVIYGADGAELKRLELPAGAAGDAGAESEP